VLPQTSNVAEAILAGGRPDAPAVWFGREVITYDALRRQAGSVGTLLLRQGLCRGDRVGLLAENSPLFIAGYLGAMRAGLCAVPLPTDCDAEAFARYAASLGMRCVLVSPRILPRIEAAAANLGVRLIGELPAGLSAAEALTAADVDPCVDLAAIMLTSGSTGEPKGVMVTHRNIECNTHDILSYMHLLPADRAMTVLPFYYCYGASLMHTHLMAGASLVLNNRFLFPEKVLDEIDEKQCTGLAGVPSTYQILLRKTRLAQRRFPSLRWLQQAGGKLPDPFLRELRQALPDARLFVMYGQTEATARLSYLPPERLDEKLGSVGRGLPNTRLEVIKEDRAPVRPGSGEVGEIVASGENIARGYWNDTEETARYFRGGKLYTGDMARVDADGYIFIVERARDFIKSAGNRVSPKEIEDAIAEMPAVVEVAVVGVPDELLGEAIRAFVVPTRPGAIAADDVRSHCLKRLPNYKVPEHVRFLPALPKTSNGKVAKAELRAFG
jgi:acyl-CoA synthetase (AMP-forming)/AMP-acid ligase II